MKLKFLGFASIGLGLCLASQISVAAEGSTFKSAHPGTVCQWLRRDNRKLYLCGALSDVDAMVQEARHYDKPTVAIQTPKSEPQAPKIAHYPQVAKTTKAITKPQVIDKQKVITTPTVLDEAIAMKTVMKASFTTPSKLKSALGFLVRAIGETKAVKQKLISISDSDFQELKSIDKVSLGIYGSYKNALRRQKALANLGIHSELVNRSAKVVVTPVQQHINTVKESPQIVPLPKAPPLPKVKPKLRKALPANHKGFLVASVEDADITLPLLALAQDKHFQILRSEPLANKVSLGIYNYREFALLRQKWMSDHGIETRIINRGDRIIRVKKASLDMIVKTTVKPQPVSPEDLAQVIKMISSN